MEEYIDMDISWMDNKLCGPANAEIFHGPKHLASGRNEGPVKRQEREELAKEIFCSNCLVSEKCLEYTLSAPKDHGGVAGNTTFQERKILRRQAAVARRNS